ncbi:MAG TPA: hypothetical protein VE109_02375 [Acidobacteriaceae bacterium]|nr:hypothetical protein [Acidobacteriaceae bacterium]
MIRLDDKPTIANEQGAQIRQSLGYVLRMPDEWTSTESAPSARG